MGLSDEEVSIIRDEISEKITSFVEKTANKNHILLIRASQGLGKTITGCKALFSREDILTILLTYEHNQLDSIINNEFLKEHDLFHLKSRNQPDEDGNLLCDHPLYQKIKKYNISIRNFLCDPEKCKKYNSCKYYRTV